MSTIMEMQNFIQFIAEIMERMRLNGGLIVPHRTLTVDVQSDYHTMEILVADIPYPPPFIHLFTLTHPDIVKVQPEPNHLPPRIIITGKPHAVNMAITGHALLAVQTSLMEMMRLQLGSSLPEAGGQNVYQVLGLSRQLDIIIEQNQRLHTLVRTLTPSTPPANPHTHRRLVTRIKRSSTGSNEAIPSTHWSTSPVIPSHPPPTTQQQPLIIPDDIASSTETSDTEGGIFYKNKTKNNDFSFSDALEVKHTLV
jgi:hypothetical protein